MPPINQRVKDLVNFFSKGSVTIFSNRIGQDYQKISRLFKIDKRNGRFPEPSSDILSSIINTFTEINSDWLYRNIGEMLKPNFEEAGLIGFPGKSVPYWNLPVTAGRSLVEIIGQTKPDGYISGLPGAEMAENILPVTGTSMEPEVPEGALIGVRKMDNWETLNTGRIYLIITHDDRMIKRIEHDAENEAILWCTSPNYPKFKIYKSDIIEIQRVCFVYNAK